METISQEEIAQIGANDVVSIQAISDLKVAKQREQDELHEQVRASIKKHREEHEQMTKGDPALSARYAEAMQFCFEIHRSHRRKGGEIPYVSHLLAVSSLVLEQGGDEDEAIAALLHDAVEDCGGRPMLERVQKKFGERVASIVEGCSDSLNEDADNKEPWRARKERYISHLNQAGRSTLLVAACDKLHNLGCTVRDLNAHGQDVWSRFSKGPGDQVWYYEQCIAAFEKAELPIVKELKRELLALKEYVQESPGARTKR